MRKYIVVIVSLIFLSSPLYAGITGYTGTIEDGNTISLQGSSLGTKTASDLYRYGTFEDGVDGNVLDSVWDPAADTTASVTPRYDTDQLRGNSTMSVLCDFSQEGNKFGSDFGNDWAITPTSQKFYVSFWRYFELTGERTTNYKGCRFEASDTGLPQLNHLDQAAGGIYLTYGREDSSSPSGSPIGISRLPEGTWEREEYYLDAGTQGNADADIALYVDAVKVAELTSFIGLTGTKRFAKVRIGHYWRRVDNADPEHYYGTMKSWIDDVVIDNGVSPRMRIEVGNNQVYDDCTHREYQPYNLSTTGTWGATDITEVTVQQGTFTGAAYIFAVQEDGTAEDGFQITFATDTTPTSLKGINSKGVLHQ